MKNEKKRRQIFSGCLAGALLLTAQPLQVVWGAEGMEPVWEKEVCTDASKEDGESWEALSQNGADAAVLEQETDEPLAAGTDWIVAGDGTLTIASDAGMANWTKAGHTQLAVWQEIREIRIEDGVTSILPGAFGECMELNKVTIPSSVTTIGHDAFTMCYGLPEVTIPHGVTSIGEDAFSDCRNLQKVTLSDSVQEIGFSAFSSCYRLREVEIPDGITRIESSVFSGCRNLRRVLLPSTVTSIGSQAFEGCQSLPEIEIPSGVTELGGYAFRGCTSLRAVNLPSGIKSIEKETFEGCENLTEIRLPDGVTSIGAEAFAGCQRLTGITVPASVTSIGRLAFESCRRLEKVLMLGGDPPMLGEQVFEKCSAALGIYVPAAAVNAYKEAWSAQGEKIRPDTYSDYQLPAPVKPVIEEKGTDQIRISWKLSEGAKGYTIWTKKEGETAYTRRQIADETTTSFTLKNCQPGTRYSFLVKPWIKAEDGSYLFSNGLAIAGTTKPEAAVIRSATANAARDLKVSVSGAAGADHYAMCYSKDPNFANYKIGVRTTYTTRTIAKGLPRGTYYVKVRPYCQLENAVRVYGEWSKTAKVVVK